MSDLEAEDEDTLADIAQKGNVKRRTKMMHPDSEDREKGKKQLRRTEMRSFTMVTSDGSNLGVIYYEADVDSSPKQRQNGEGESQETTDDDLSPEKPTTSGNKSISTLPKKPQTQNSGGNMSEKVEERKLPKSAVESGSVAKKTGRDKKPVDKDEKQNKAAETNSSMKKPPVEKKKVGRDVAAESAAEEGTVSQEFVDNLSVGDEVYASDQKRSGWYLSRVVERDGSNRFFTIHYMNFNTRYDEAIEFDEARERIKEYSGPKRLSSSQEENMKSLKVGSYVSATFNHRFHDAKVTAIDTNGDVTVLFYDGMDRVFSKSSLPTNVRIIRGERLKKMEQKYANVSFGHYEKFTPKYGYICARDDEAVVEGSRQRHSTGHVAHLLLGTRRNRGSCSPGPSASPAAESSSKLHSSATLTPPPLLPLADSVTTPLSSDFTHSPLTEEGEKAKTDASAFVETANRPRRTIKVPKHPDGSDVVFERRVRRKRTLSNLSEAEAQPQTPKPDGEGERKTDDGDSSSTSSRKMPAPSAAKVPKIEKDAKEESSNNSEDSSNDDTVAEKSRRRKSSCPKKRNVEHEAAKKISKRSQEEKAVKILTPNTAEETSLKNLRFYKVKAVLLPTAKKLSGVGPQQGKGVQAKRKEETELVTAKKESDRPAIGKGGDISSAAEEEEGKTKTGPTRQQTLPAKANVSEAKAEKRRGCKSKTEKSCGHATATTPLIEESRRPRRQSAENCLSRMYIMTANLNDKKTTASVCAAADLKHEDNQEDLTRLVVADILPTEGASVAECLVAESKSFVEEEADAPIEQGNSNNGRDVELFFDEEESIRDEQFETNTASAAEQLLDQSAVEEACEARLQQQRRHEQARLALPKRETIEEFDTVIYRDEAEKAAEAVSNTTLDTLTVLLEVGQLLDRLKSDVVEQQQEEQERKLQEEQKKEARKRQEELSLNEHVVEPSNASADHAVLLAKEEKNHETVVVKAVSVVLQSTSSLDVDSKTEGKVGAAVRIQNHVSLCSATDRMRLNSCERTSKELLTDMVQHDLEENLGKVTWEEHSDDVQSSPLPSPIKPAKAVETYESGTDRIVSGITVALESDEQPAVVERNPPAPPKRKRLRGRPKKNKPIRLPPSDPTDEQEEHRRTKLEQDFLLYSIGRTDFLARQGDKIYCVPCRHYGAVGGRWSSGLHLSNVRQVTEHELRQVHLANMKRFYLEMYNMEPPKRQQGDSSPSHFVCELCSRSFRNQDALNGHYKVKHQNSEQSDKLNGSKANSVVQPAVEQLLPPAKKRKYDKTKKKPMVAQNEQLRLAVPPKRGRPPGASTKNKKKKTPSARTIVEEEEEEEWQRISSCSPSDSSESDEEELFDDEDEEELLDVDGPPDDDEDEDDVDEDLLSSTTTAAQERSTGEEVDERLIRCRCRKNQLDSKGLVVQCTRCRTYQHTWCVRQHQVAQKTATGKKWEVDIDYLCYVCIDPPGKRVGYELRQKNRERARKLGLLPQFPSLKRARDQLALKNRSQIEAAARAEEVQQEGGSSCGTVGELKTSEQRAPYLKAAFDLVSEVSQLKQMTNVMCRMQTIYELVNFDLSNFKSGIHSKVSIDAKCPKFSFWLREGEGEGKREKAEAVKALVADIELMQDKVEAAHHRIAEKLQEQQAAWETFVGPTVNSVDSLKTLMVDIGKVKKAADVSSFGRF